MFIGLEFDIIKLVHQQTVLARQYPLLIGVNHLYKITAEVQECHVQDCHVAAYWKYTFR